MTPVPSSKSLPMISDYIRESQFVLKLKLSYILT